MKKNLEEISISQNIYSVTDLNLYVKSLFIRDENLQDVWVKGEISNFTHHKENHMYFVLKDEKSEINCAMFSTYNKDLDFEPEEGMEVLCRGDVGLYTQRGQYQLVIKEMILGGIGKLYLAYENLKKKLLEEGLFDKKHKKEIPFLPKRVGIVTSEEGAALKDMVSVLKRRFSNIDILLSPAPVQGEGASKKIVKAIQRIDREGVDVIIIGRGGGSVEDLWNFNEEKVARAIFQAETPIISAVGHETDFLISDFVADTRAETPSAAAEAAVPSKEKLLKRIEEQKNRSDVALQNIVVEMRNRLNNIARSPFFKRPERLLEEGIQRLDENAKDLQKNIRNILKGYENLLTTQSERLTALGPHQTMKRGYSIVKDEDGSILKSVKDANKGDIIGVEFLDGKILAEIEEVIRSKKKR
ncbi:MAG: exodeoxyribonuclease VII large subunit [Thermoplasmatota archaeon]